MPEVVLTDYHEVQQAFRRKALKQALYDEGGVVMRDALLTLHGRDHRERRRLENRLFRREVFRLYDRELMPDIISETLAPFVAAGRADLLPIGHRTTLHLTARIAGVDRIEQTTEETEALYALVLKFSDGATLVHSTRDHELVRGEVAAALEDFDVRFLRPSAQRRRELLNRFRAGELDEDDLPKDVLTVLLHNQDDLHLPDDVVRREIAFYLQAGSHSSANAFTHAMDDIFGWLEHHPEDRDRLVEDRVLLQRFVHESLRLHPASPVAWRVATEDTQLRDGRQVPAGTKVIMDLMQANRDPSVFGEDADRYNPHREPADGAPLWGHTFGGGMHVCIGQELDGGISWDQAGGSAEEHVLGVVPMLVQVLLRAGARPDPDDPPRWDDNSERPHFGVYPVRFGDG